MDVLKCIETRRSVRKYKDEMVPQELLDKVVKAGLYAPSGMNRQPVVIVQVTNKAMRDRLAHLNAAVMGRYGDPFYGAPVVLVVLARKDCFTYLYDGTLAMGYMMLEAHELGLGSCWVHRAKEVFASDEGKAILRELGLNPDIYEGIGNCILGYADCEIEPALPRNEGRVFAIK